MQNNVQKIKDKLNIVDVIGSYLKLQRAGINFKAPCPFHNEKTPSFFVSPDRGTYKCFGCGAGGDIFSFIEQFEGVDFPEALKLLAERSGIELVRDNPQIKDERNRLYEIIENATLYFEFELEKKKEASKYLEERGLKKETIKKFRLGFVQNEWRNLYEYLQKNNFLEKDIEKVGLIKKTEKGFYDRFRGRIIFPLFDNIGRPIAFSGRLFENDGKSAKYLNSPETVLFNKSKVLYGYNFAKNDIRKRGFSILVEGQMDLVMSHQSGFTNTVATSGTALTSQQLVLLKRISDKLMIAFDADNAGLVAANKGAKLALGEGMEVKLVEIPKNLDPADLILQNKEKWSEAIKNAVHIIEFNLNSLVCKEPDQRKLGLKISEVVLPLVSEVKNKIEQNYFILKIADKTGIEEKVLREELTRIGGEPAPEKSYENNFILNDKKDLKKIMTKKQRVIREISGILYWQKTLKKPVIDIKKTEDDFKKIIEDEIFEKIKRLPDSTVNEIIFETENLYLKSNDLEKKIKILLGNLEKEILIEKRNLISKKLKQVEEGCDKEKEYFKKHKELSKQIESIS